MGEAEEKNFFKKDFREGKETFTSDGFTFAQAMRDFFRLHTTALIIESTTSHCGIKIFTPCIYIHFIEIDPLSPSDFFSRGE